MTVNKNFMKIYLVVKIQILIGIWAKKMDTFQKCPFYFFYLSYLMRVIDPWKFFLSSEFKSFTFALQV